MNTTRRLIIYAAALGAALAVLFVPTVDAQTDAFYAHFGEPTGRPVVYKTVDGRPLHLYITDPPQKVPNAVHPAIVFVHGGGWTSGSVAQFNRQSIALAARGMVAIDVEYRLAPKPLQSFQPCVEDTKSAFRWVRAHARELHVDPARIVGSGGSAGAYLAAAAALVPAWDDPSDNLAISPKPNALVLFFPAIAYDAASPTLKFFGDKMQYAPETYLTAAAPPTILFAGSADKLVKLEALQHYKLLADKAGARVDLIVYPDQVHGFANDEPYTTITLQAAEHFLESIGYLEPK